MSLRILFKWYDFFIGVYYDRENACVYIFPLPCIGLRWRLIRREHLYFQGDGIAFGAERKYYKWKWPFVWSVWGGTSIFKYEEVDFQEWYKNMDKKISRRQHIAVNLWALFPIRKPTRNLYTTTINIFIILIVITLAMYIGHKANQVIYHFLNSK